MTPLELIAYRKSKYIRRTTISVDGPGPDSAILRGKNEIGLGSVNYITDDHSIPCSQLSRSCCVGKHQGMKVTRKTIIQANRYICFKQLHEACFELRPSSNVVNAANDRRT